MIQKHQGFLYQNSPLVVSSPIRGEPNNLIMGDLVFMVKQPKQPNNLISDLPTIRDNTKHLDVSKLENSANQRDRFLGEREKILQNLTKKQDFLVWTGKATDKWETYKTFKPEYCLRQILDDEIVIEFDSDDLELVTKAVMQTGLNLIKANIDFEYWYFEGCRSPHLHIHNLPIKQYSESQRKLFKKIFIRKYVPLEYLSYVDLSLIDSKHLIALEWSPHWKSLLPISNPKHRNTGVKRLVAQNVGGIYT